MLVFIVSNVLKEFDYLSILIYNQISLGIAKISNNNFILFQSLNRFLNSTFSY